MKNIVKLTESHLKKVISESVKNVLKETIGLDTDNHAEASYFQIMRLRLSSLSNSSNPKISSRAREILNDIKLSNMTPFECLKTYWDETQELKKSYDLCKNSLGENRVIKENYNPVSEGIMNFHSDMNALRSDIDEIIEGIYDRNARERLRMMDKKLAQIGAEFAKIESTLGFLGNQN